MDKPTVVIDNGSGHVKAGLAGQDDKPSVVFPALVGRPKHDNAMPGCVVKEHFMGEEALARKGVLSLTYPLEHGVVRNWEDMEKVWHHIFFDALRVNPEEHAVIVTEAPMNPKKNRERMVEMLFEKFCCPATYVVIQAVMSLFASGRTTGCVVDSGDGVTHVVPVYEGYCMPHAVQRLDLAGRDLSEYMVKVLTESGFVMQSSAEREIVRHMKETCCYVSLEGFEEKLKIAQANPTEHEKHYTLPDGQVVTLMAECFRIPEVLFDPMMCGRELMGIDKATYTSIHLCDIDLRKDLFKNIVLSGGTTMFEGIKERLEKELRALAPQKVKVDVHADKDRKYIVWMGAAVVAGLSNFEKMVIWKSEYDETGSTIVHRKCF